MAAAYGCERAPPVAEGHKLTDSKQKTWTVGKPIGSGGFGAIYLCDPGQNKVCLHIFPISLLHYILCLRWLEMTPSTW